MACTFVWPPNYLSREFQTGVEAELSQRVAQTGADPLLCHAGTPEINIAYTMPMCGNVDAVVVCACGAPCATIRGKAGDDASWCLTRTSAALRAAPGR